MDGWIIGVVAGLVAGVVTVVGNGLVIKKLRDQINALKGTIETQDKTLKTIGEVNRTVLEVFKVMDPERWAKEVEVHKRLADEKAQAIVEAEKRKLAQDRAALQDNAGKLVDHYKTVLGIGLRLIPYVPHGMRHQVLDEIRGSQDIKDVFREVAEKAPDWSSTGRGLAALLSSSPPPVQRIFVARPEEGLKGTRSESK